MVINISRWAVANTYFLTRSREAGEIEVMASFNFKIGHLGSNGKEDSGAYFVRI